MSTELQIVLAIIAAVATWAALAFGIWKFLDSKINKALDRADTSRADLQEYKLHVAENYATKQSVSDLGVSITKTITDVGIGLNDRFDTMTRRLDSFIDGRNGIHHHTTPVRKPRSSD
jgi:hypothetical protein